MTGCPSTVALSIALLSISYILFRSYNPILYLIWFRLFRFRSPLLTESRRFLFLGLLRCFTSPRLALLGYSLTQQQPRMNAAGLSHSEIRGLTPACGYPRLIAACYVLPRLLAPRHSPSALSSFHLFTQDFLQSQVVFFLQTSPFPGYSRFFFSLSYSLFFPFYLNFTASSQSCQ